MSRYFKSDFFQHSVLMFIAIPLLIWALGGFPERSVLKDLLSIITILAFCQLLGQFFWTRSNRSAVAEIKMSNITEYHKIIGYACILILLFHPLFLVAPRFFESGISPADAFFSIITTLNQGVVTGITAWFLMLVLGITSLARRKMPIKYKTWRLLHGILAMLFISTATWHVLDLGRHSNFAMSVLISMLSTVGILLLLKTYAFKKSKQPKRIR